jgi:hypothetical protein
MSDTTAPAGKSLGWFLRSLADHDTHRADGVRAEGNVLALCGVEFTPKPTVRLVGKRFVDGFPDLGSPPVPEQVCPDCRGGGVR